MSPCATTLLLGLVLYWGIDTAVAGDRIEKISLPLAPDIQRADIYVWKPSPRPGAVLVLCPGFNGNGESWIENSTWRAFARAHNLGVASLSFASDGELLRQGRGYYYPTQGSGKLLLDALDHAFDPGLPLLLYGFSGGAHVTAGLVNWKPQRIAGWCAYSAEWWNKPSASAASPPGLVVCGDEDERYGASLLFFKQGRALGKPWLWLSVARDGHEISPHAEDFVRSYFATILAAQKSKTPGLWVDVDFKTIADQRTVSGQPSLTGWLPSAKLLDEWQSIHAP